MESIAKGFMAFTRNDLALNWNSLEMPLAEHIHLLKGFSPMQAGRMFKKAINPFAINQVPLMNL